MKKMATNVEGITPSVQGTWRSLSCSSNSVAMLMPRKVMVGPSCVVRRVVRFLVERRSVITRRRRRSPRKMRMDSTMFGVSVQCSGEIGYLVWRCLIILPDELTCKARQQEMRTKGNSGGRFWVTRKNMFLGLYPRVCRNEVVIYLAR